MHTFLLLCRIHDVRDVFYGAINQPNITKQVELSRETVELEWDIFDKMKLSDLL